MNDIISILPLLSNILAQHNLTWLIAPITALLGYLGIKYGKGFIVPTVNQATDAINAGVKAADENIDKLKTNPITKPLGDGLQDSLVQAIEHEQESLAKLKDQITLN